MIFAGVNGFVDKVAEKDVTRYEKSLLDDVRANGQDLLETIRTEKQITSELEEKLKAFCEKFTKSFA